MVYLTIFILACLIFFLSAITFFSGFGLGTLLMPLLALYYPVSLAIAMAAIVHLATNGFRIFLTYRHISGRVVIWFGLPAILFALIGAWLLTQVAIVPTTWQYQIFGYEREVTVVKLLIGILIILFALWEIAEGFPRRFPAFPLRLLQFKFSKKFLPLGGALSGFFGGLSGHQGALRSMFLLKSGLTKEQYIATGAAISALVDVARLQVYSLIMVDFNLPLLMGHFVSGAGLVLLLVCILSFLGAYTAWKSLNRMSFFWLRNLVAFLLINLGTSMLLGWI